MITNRLNITVPAAGAQTLFELSGRLVYVELSPDNTPAGVPVFSLESSGDGLPLYTKTKFIVCNGFNRFWIRGTTESAGSILNLLIVDDPCVTIGNFRPNPCGGSGAVPPYDPDGVPTSFISYRTTDISNLALDGSVNSALVASIVSPGSNCNPFFVDPELGLLFYGTYDNVTDNEWDLRRVELDGSNDALVTALPDAVSSVTFCIDRLRSRGAYLYGGLGTGAADGDRYIGVNLLGDTAISVAAITTNWLIDAHDDVHAYRKTGGLSRIRLSNGTSNPAISGNYNEFAFDPQTQKLFAIKHFSSSGSLRSFDPDLTGEVTLSELDLSTSRDAWITIVGRWLYFPRWNGSAYIVCRAYIDDLAQGVVNVEDVSDPSAQFGASTTYGIHPLFA